MKGCAKMVANKGFSFNNIVGMYAIKEMSTNHKLNSTNKIITALYPGNLKQLYSQNSYEEGSIAYEFQSIDTNDVEQIIQFCNQYGLLLYLFYIPLQIHLSLSKQILSQIGRASCRERV